MAGIACIVRGCVMVLIVMEERRPKEKEMKNEKVNRCRCQARERFSFPSQYPAA